MRRRGELNDEQWQRLKRLLPPQKQAQGRPCIDHRHILEGILWIHRTGSPWRDLPERYGPWQTIATRFYRWSKRGVWQRILGRLQQEADHQGEFNWSKHHLDSSSIRAHQHAAGAKGGSRSLKRWDEVEGVSAPSCTYGLKETASRWLWWSQLDSNMRARSLKRS